MVAPDGKPGPLAHTSRDFVPANKLNKGSDCATTVLKRGASTRESAVLLLC